MLRKAGTSNIRKLKIDGSAGRNTMPCERQILQVEVLCLDRKSFKALLGPLEDIIRRNTTRWERAPPRLLFTRFIPQSCVQRLRKTSKRRSKRLGISDYREQEVGRRIASRD